MIRKVEFHNFVKKIGMLMFSDATESYYGNQIKLKIHQKNSYENEKKNWKKIEKKSEQILRKQNCCIFFSQKLFFV